MSELKTMIFNWSSGGLIYEKDLKSIGITIKPDKYKNYVGFSIQFGSYNPLEISKDFNSAINLPQKVMNITPNYPIVDEFCEKIKNFDFEKFGISSHIQSPQEIDMVGRYTIIYEMNDGSDLVTVENPNNKGIINLCMKFILGYILKDEDLKKILTNYLNDNITKCSNLKELLKKDVEFNPKEDFGLENFEYSKITNENEGMSFEEAKQYVDKLNDEYKKAEEEKERELKENPVTVDNLLSKINNELDNYK